jgi:Na+/melibiose symporter-like transporter
VFAGLINQAKSAASHLVLKYVARASVAVPFVIAAGFALAALTVMLVERFGHVMAYWLVAGGLGLIGVIASIVVSVKEHEEEVAEEQAAKTDTEEVVSDATAQALVQTPIALLGALFTTPGGAAGALSAARLLGRNWPLVLLLVMMGALFWPTKDGERVEDDVDAVRKPNGSDDQMPSALRH